MKRMRTRAIILSMILGIGGMSAATYTWNGGSSTGFFTATNWIDSSTGKAPSSLSAGVAINNDLYIGEGSSIGKNREIKGIINAGSGKITLKKATLRTDYGTVTGIRSSVSLLLDSSIVLVGNLDVPKVVISGKSELHLYEPEKALTSGTRIDLQGEDAWLYFLTKKPSEVIKEYLSYITIDGSTARLNGNMRVFPYFGGSVVIPHKPSTKALFMYSGENLTGSEQYFRSGLKTGEKLCSGKNEAKSFKLKKGYMAVIGKKANGHTAKSYIASDNDVIINLKVNGVDDTVRFVRVAPWKWVCKKGMAGSFDGIDETWNYNWGASDSEVFDNKQFVPMRHNKYWPGLGGLLTSNDYTHLLGYNEADNFGIPSHDAMTVDEALNLWPILEETGLLLGSPVPTNTPAGLKWLQDFMDSTLVRGYRVDYICLHNYEKMDPTYFVNNWCKSWYDKYNLPIWVTEYNYGAPWNTNDEDFLDEKKRSEHFRNFQAYTQKMDDAPFIERYALFPFYADSANLVDSVLCSFEVSPSVLARPGIWYRDLESNPENGNPLMYRRKIIETKALENPVQIGDAYDRHGFNLLSRRNDGSDSRRVGIRTKEGDLFNFAVMGGNSIGIGGVAEQFTFGKVDDRFYTIKANNNCLALTVRNDSVLVTEATGADNQLWEVLEIVGSKYFALKNKTNGKYLAPEGGVISVGTVLRVVEISDINGSDTQVRAAHWDLKQLASCECKPEIENPFVISVEPLTGIAPLTVTMNGANFDLDGAPAYYRWDIHDVDTTMISTRYTDTYTFEKPGTYTIQVKGRDHVSVIKTNLFTIEVKEWSGVEKNEGAKFVISPNPVTEEFNLLGLSGGERVIISNIQGTTVYDGIYRNNSISLGNLSAGIYIVKVEGYDPVKLIKK